MTDAPRLPLVDDYHGTPVPDPYRWLEDPATFPADQAEQWRAWRAEWDAGQRARYDADAAAWTMRPGFADRLTALLGGGYQGLPTWRGQRQFFMRRDPGQQFGVLLTVDPDGTERVLIDPIARDPSGLTTLDGYVPSWEGDKLAYLMSEGGTEESVLRVLDVTTGQDLDAPIDRTRYSPVAWLPGGEAFYYVRRLHPELAPADESAFHRRVRLHRLGADADTDPEILGAGLTVTNYYGVGITPDGRWLVVDAAEGTAPRNDVWLADLAGADPAAPPLRAVVAGRDAQTSLSIRPDGRMFVWTDFQAPRGRILLGDPASPQPEHWRDLVAEDPESVLDAFRVVDGPDAADQYLLVSRSAHTIGSLALLDSVTGAPVRTIDTPGAGTITGPTSRPGGGHEAWFGYTDHVTPPVLLHLDTRTGTVTEWARPPGSVDVPDVVSQLVSFRSGDGTQVRLTVIAPTAAPTRPLPTILYGYGGFGVSLPPAYSATALAWVAAGGVYAIANLRGGGEEGEDWHRAGMLANKQAVFDDFHAAAQYLIDAGWTTPAQLCISGGSNGGLLVGAAITQRPELYGAVLCAAPLLDMIRYVTSQLGATWTVEYGDPARPEEFAWLWDYSPYHRVRAGTDYPAVLMMVFDNDTRTDPMHGRKFVAALQHATSGTRPIVLRSEGDVGHGMRSLAKSVAETADSLAFAAHHTGLGPA